MSATFGYIRVSGTDQVLDLQRDALAAIRCDRVWEEVASGAKDDRPALLDLLGHLRAGDTLVVWRLDRLGRSLKHLIETVEDLQRRVSFSEDDCTVSCDFGLVCSCLLTFCVQKCSALGSCARGHAAEACGGRGENQRRRERRTDGVR